jgi:5'-deoxynucleotidase YfbR-like HD superfamily hydrolase
MITTVNQQTRKENEKISKIIDRVMRQVFGDEATRLIYRYLENNYSVKRDEIADKIDLFAKGLENFLRSGAYVIERKILEDIYSSYGLLRRIELEKLREGDFASQVKLLMRKT